MQPKIIIVLLLFLSILFSCGTTKHISSEVSEKENTRVEYRERIKYITDTVYLTIQSQVSEREVRDSVSHLENKYSFSDARINPDGTLYHTLSVKDQKVAFPIQRVIEYRDSIIYKDRVIKNVGTETKYIEKKRGWFAGLQIYGFWFFILVLVIVVGLKLLFQFRLF